MKKIKNPVTVLDHLTNRMIDDHNMKEKEHPKDESKEDEFIELDVPIKTPLWEDDESKEVSHFEFDENGDNVIVTEPKQPYYKGKGEHSVNELETICQQYKDYVNYLKSK